MPLRVRESAWLFLKVPDFCSLKNAFGSLRMAESAWKCLMPRKPKNQETYICFQWKTATTPRGVGKRAVRGRPKTPFWEWSFVRFWKRLEGKNPEGKNFRKLLRRKQSSAKISKISRNTLNLKSSKRDILYLLRNLLKYLSRPFFFRRAFRNVCLCVFDPLALYWRFSSPLFFHPSMASPQRE